MYQTLNSSTFAWLVITGCCKKGCRHNMHGVFVEKTQKFRLLHFLSKIKIAKDHELRLLNDSTLSLMKRS